MQRTCARCGKPFEARRSTAKYCGSTCRSAESLRPVTPEAREEVANALLESIKPPSPLVLRIEAELRAAGRLETAKGQMALELAAAYGNPFDNGSQKVSLMRAVKDLLDDALEGASVSDDPLDELKARRVARRSG